MSGKAYTMREMKGIVDYLVEHKAYSEIRGRKMWMEFANSSATTRTWQSLKETFLKRILQDIQNPYYMLTRDQVCSFKQGCDVEAKEKNNRLEIRTASDSSHNSENQKNTEQPTTKSTEKGNEVEKTPGEEIKSAKIPARNRSSADTLILDESNPQDNPKSPDAVLEPNTKTLKECLEFEYSEPLTPVVREVLEDFETESENSDRMQIVEHPENETSDLNKESELIIIEDSENIEVENNAVETEKMITEDGHEVEVGPVFVEEIVAEDHTIQDIDNWLKDCVQNEQENPNENLTEVNESNPAKENEKYVAKNNCDDVILNTVSNTEKGKSVKESNAVKENSVDTEKEKSNDPVEPDNGDVNKCKSPETVEPVGENVDVTSKGNEKKSINNEEKTKDSLSTTADTIIPNNQEVIDADSTTNKVNTQDTLLTAEKDNIVTRKRSTSQDKTVNKKIKLDNGVSEKTKKASVVDHAVIEINTASTNDTELAFNALLKDTVDKNKPSTSKDAQMEVVPLKKNPCLQSVSLFEEQFNNTKYSDSEEETPIPKNEEYKTSKVTHVNKMKDVKSHSDNEVEESSVQPTDNPTQRYKHLAKAFGFIPGTSTAVPRRKSLRCRNRRSKSQRNSITLRSESSQWETGSASETYVSPPRGRRNRHARRYMRPHSERILSLDDDGGLFVACRNKIYPLVKDGKVIKSYVTYNAGSGSEEEENSYWRQKYVEEKKKTAELQKKLEQAKVAAEKASKRAISPNLPANPTRESSDNRTAQTSNDSDMNNKMNIEKKGDSGKIHITLSKSKEETINLEGHWPQVLPIVNQVMSIFYKTDSVTDSKPEVQPKPKEDISGLVTPIIPVVDLATREKVEELESAIFKEIEERDKVDSTKENDNVTKRRAVRSKKTPSTSSGPSEPNTRQKKSKKSLPEKAEPTTQVKTNELPQIVVTSDVSTKPTAETAKDDSKNSDKNVLKISETKKDKSPAKPQRDRGKERVVANGKDTDNESAKSTDRKTDSESKHTVGTVDAPATRMRNRRSRKSGNETDSSSRTVTTRLSSKSKEDLDEEVRYMLPPEPKTRSAKSTPKKARSSEEPHEVSQDSRSRNSIDSTQGYQDSDTSPMRVQRMNIAKRKRKVSLTVRKGKPVTRRRSFSTFHDISLDSSNSSYFVPLKTSKSTLDSAIYKSESYQILMQNRKHSLNILKPIEETNPMNSEDRHFDAVSKESSESNLVIEIGSSSNVSLPLSPELSVVENLSISREMIRDENHPTINETQANDLVGTIYNQYLISEVDASVPLMQQECLINRENQKLASSGVEASLEPESFTNKVCTVNMSHNNTLSESLDKRLRDLLLESAKKMTDKDKENQMDVDEYIEPPKKRGKKRCSTPQKRKTTMKVKALGPVMEEHMETCSHGGRNSCPPVITFIPVDENANSADVKIIAKPKARVKKDIIRVKIQRPKDTQIKRSRSKDPKERSQSTASSTSRLSVCTDSGINETASMSGAFQGSDSVELIHNHSETCLQANECIGDSVEFVENSKSVISLNSTESLENELMKVMEDMDKLSGEYRIRSAMNGSGDKSSEVFGTPTDTVYHSPVASNTSLLTEDLSEEAPLPPTNWHLLSEDETNTRPENITSNTRVSNFTANLKKLFPIALAVPDLSIISEISRESESRRTGLDTDGDSRNSDYPSPV